MKKVEAAAGTKWTDSTPSCHVVNEHRSSNVATVAVSSQGALAPTEENDMDVSRMTRVAHERLQHARERQDGGG